MKYFEINYPYYSLIGAEDKGRAEDLYIKHIAEPDEDDELEFNEVDSLYALEKFKEGLIAFNEKHVTLNDMLTKLNEGGVLLVDGSLL